MELFEEMEARGHEELIFNYIEDADLKMIISLHDTTPGKTLGGLCMNTYDSDMTAVIESLKLSQIMTYQCATADVDSGGSNVLLLGNPKADKTEAFFRALGRLIESLKGRIYIYPDMGIDPRDLIYIQRETDNTIFLKQINDNSKPSAHVTALSVYWGIKACAKTVFNKIELDGLSFSVQGLGKVGKELVDLLKQENTRVFVSDLVYDNIKEVEDKYRDIEVLSPEELLFKETDFLVPCAIGSIITNDNISKLKCRVIAGSAYNIFADDSLIEKIHKRNIIYAPDFVISSGELFLLDNNLKLGNLEKANENTKIIFTILFDILQRAAIKGVSPYEIAIKDAMLKYKKIDQIKNILC